MDFNKYNIFTPNDLLKYFEKNMVYGFKYKNKVFLDTQPDFNINMEMYYKLRLKEDFIKSKYGVCWDFCELEREFFIANGVPHECYFALSFYSEDSCGPTHTFPLFKQGNKWCWFEFAWGYYKGIWEYSTKEEALKDIVKKLNQFFGNNFIKIMLFKTNRVNTRLDFNQYVQHAIKCSEVKLK